MSNKIKIQIYCYVKCKNPTQSNVFFVLFFTFQFTIDLELFSFLSFYYLFIYLFLHVQVEARPPCLRIATRLPEHGKFLCNHDDVIKWKHFPRYWPFVRGIHRSPLNSSHKGQWHGALMFSLMCARINGWVNNGDAGDLRRHRAHCDVIVMLEFDGNTVSGTGARLPRQ